MYTAELRGNNKISKTYNIDAHYMFILYKFLIISRYTLVNTHYTHYVNIKYLYIYNIGERL